MQAAVFNKPFSITVQDMALPEISSDEILLKVGACGVCGTDFHIFSGEAPSKQPVVLGHEYAGEVVDIGKDVKLFQTEDHVAINPNIHCGFCDYCKKGKVNLCSNLKALGVTINGGFSQYAVVPASQAYFIPKTFPYEHAAFSEPLSCCVHGIDQAGIKLNDIVAIIGAGTIGLLMIQLAKLQGASKVIAIDTSEEKIELAKIVGADHTINPNTENCSEKILDFTKTGADVSIECAGNKNAVETAVSVLGKGGTLLIFGLADPSAKAELLLQKFFHKELSIKSSLLNPFTFQTAVDLLTTGKINVEPFSPQKIILEQSVVSSLFNEPRKSSVIKHMIVPYN